MKIQQITDDRKMKIWFDYTGLTDTLKPSTTATVIFMDNDGNPKETFVGVAKKNPEDRFEKERGRKVALRKALRDIDKNIRRKVWAYYFSRSPKTASYSLTTTS